MKKNQKGFTLVELIIAVAILAIVTLAVCGFIVVGSRSYTSANTDIMLQQDAQLALNQISDVIIDTTDSISYGLRSGGSGDMQLVLKDSEFAGEADEKCLVVVNKQEAGSVNDNKSYWFYWNKDDEIIYFNEVDASSDMDDDDIKSAFEDAAKQENVFILAQHVKEFSVDISQFEANRVVMISVLFANGNREYATSNNVTVRNRIAINRITVDPMTRAKEFTITVVPSLTLEPNDFYELSDKVSVGGDAEDQALSFEIVGGEVYGTRVSDTGYLTVGPEEIRSNFSVKVSRKNEEYTGQNDRVAKTIRINVKRANTVNIGGPDTAKQGETVELTNSRAAGNLLGVRCDADTCASDDLSKDYDLHGYLSTGNDFGWKIISGGSYAEITNPTSSSASVKISQDAPVGTKITIQASSLLSDTKRYGNPDTPTVPPVTGTKTITVEKKDSKTREMDSDFVFGMDQQVMDWLKQGMEYLASDYVIYARVQDPSGEMADKWVLYSSNVGENMRFYPDMFGLELDRSYKLYMQAIVRVPMSVIENSGGQTYFNSTTYNVSQYDGLLRQVFADTSNFDSVTGEYIGGQFYAGPYYEATISPPAIVSITCNDGNGKNYVFPGEGEDYSVKYSLFTGNDTVINSIWMPGRSNSPNSSTDNANIPEKYMTQMHLSVYKGEGNSIDNWQFVAGYNPDTGEISGNFLDGKGGTMEMFYLNDLRTGKPDLVANNFLKRKTNITDMAAAGTYHIVPGFVYANQEQITEEGREYYFIYRSFERGDGSLDGDFDDNYYLQPDCAITVKVVSGFSMEMTISGGKKAKVAFPVPSDGSFPFELQKEGAQELPWWPYADYGLYDDSNVLIQTINLRPVCTWDKSTDTYTIEFFNYNGGYYGQYKCRYGADSWECTKAGTVTNW